MSTAALPRELLKWLQSLDLTWTVRAPKWEMSNGYLVAEIFSWYFPQIVEMRMYHNDSSLRMKLHNWSQLKRVMKKQSINIPDDVIDATIHCKDGAAFILLQLLYECLTNRQLNVLPPEPPIDFTDHGYQSKIPIHARSTAIQAIRNNIKLTELMTTPNFIINRQKAQAVIARHTQDRDQQRIENPDRFDRRPTLGELARRRPPPPSRHISGSMENIRIASFGSHVGFDEGSIKNASQSGSGRKKSSNQNNRSSGIRRAPSAIEIIVNQSTHLPDSPFQDNSMPLAATSPPPPPASLSPTIERCRGGLIACECCN